VLKNIRLPVKEILALLLLTVAPVLHVHRVEAVEGLFNRRLTLESSLVDANTRYLFQFDYTIAANIGSLHIEFCTNTPIPYEPCTIPSGLDVSAVALDTQTGETGFSIDGGNSDANNIVLTRAPAMVTPQTSSYNFSNAVNPDTAGTYYVRLYTFASIDATGPSTEEAGIAIAIIEGLGVSAYVPPFLQFCVGVTITGVDCLTATGSFLDFGTLSENTARTATSQMAAGTNGVGGVSISMIGTTMTSGINTIPGLNVRSPSNVGTSQFGLNLRNNSSPNVGIDEVGAGTIAPTTDYNVVNRFTFRDGDVVANSPISTEFSTMTSSYIVNIDPNQAAGVYSTTLTYVATATF